MDYISPLYSQRTKEGYEQLVNKWHDHNNVPQFEYSGQCLYDNSSWDSISGKKHFTDEDDQNSIEKSIRWKMMKIIIESPQKLTDDDLETILGMWTRKFRKIAV